ncbi:hypothetical protein [Thermosediminibacter oceani]|uniref:Methyl-accepting chemotaxis sensory transducer n=1 Tax=Thermosediminibacter oceani (strain ATCC BAA-1034 / DSM 16646 / JW/IW-1228P) TaxID=555079 RepID=D9S2B9_THEOJ|nr:hypothetical protein [Thermosediminibacter oceani]ADL07546.1 hypothetical protein Toce_0781 [Thermosediminibacter oceani DSM 16646]
MGRTCVKTAGDIMNLQAQMEALLNELKALETDLDETLQQLLVKSSGHIELSKKLGEMELIAEFLKEYGRGEDAVRVKNLIRALRQRVYESIGLVVFQVQKSTLKAVEALNDAGNGLLMIGKFGAFLKNLQELERTIQE